MEPPQTGSGTMVSPSRIVQSTSQLVSTSSQSTRSPRSLQHSIAQTTRDEGSPQGPKAAAAAPKGATLPNHPDLFARNVGQWQRASWANNKQAGSVRMEKHKCVAHQQPHPHPFPRQRRNMVPSKGGMGHPRPWSTDERISGQSQLLLGIAKSGSAWLSVMLMVS